MSRPSMMARRHATRLAAAALFLRAVGASAQPPLEAGLLPTTDSLSPRPGRGRTAPTAPAPGARLIARLAVPIDPHVAPSPDGRFLAVLQTRPDPVLWVVPTDGGRPFAFRKMWAAYRPRWSPSGGRVGFIAAIGPPRVWTVEVDPASGRAIDPPRLLIRTAANAFAFSPDGGRIALVPARSTAAGASEIRIVEWDSRRSRTVLREDGMVYQLDWAPDGATLYYARVRNDVPADAPHELRRVPLRGGSPETLRSVAEFLGLSPDGRYLLYRPGHPTASDVVEIARLDGKLVARVTLAPDIAGVAWSADSRALLEVRPGPAGDAIWRTPLCPGCGLAIW